MIVFCYEYSVYIAALGCLGDVAKQSRVPKHIDFCKGFGDRNSSQQIELSTTKVTSYKTNFAQLTSPKNIAFFILGWK